MPVQTRSGGKTSPQKKQEKPRGAKRENAVQKQDEPTEPKKETEEIPTKEEHRYSFHEGFQRFFDDVRC